MAAPQTPVHIGAGPPPGWGRPSERGGERASALYIYICRALYILGPYISGRIYKRGLYTYIYIHIYIYMYGADIYIYRCHTYSYIYIYMGRYVYGPINRLYIGALYIRPLLIYIYIYICM